MSLPNSDPSLPSNPAPIFQDNSFVRGDHSRANNQAIWGNLEYLDALVLARALLAGSSSQNFAANNLTAAGNLTVSGNAKIDDIIELSIGGVTNGIIAVVSGGKVRIYSNAYNDAGVIKLRTTGYSDITVQGDGATGETHKYTFSGNAGDTIVIGPDHSRLGTDSFYLGRNRTADGTSLLNLISVASELNYNSRIIRASGINGNLNIVNKGTGLLQILTNDTVLGLSQDQNGQVKANATTASTSTTTGSFVSAGGVGIGGALYVGENINLVAGKAIINQWFGDDSDTINDLAVTGLTSGTWLVFVSGIAIGNSGTDVILIREGGSTGTIKATLEDAGTSPIKASNFAVISGTSFYIDVVNSAQRVMVAWTRMA